MTINFLGDVHIKYLERDIRRLTSEEIEHGNKGCIPRVGRIEAAILLLNLNGYKWDRKLLEAVKFVPTERK